MSGTNYTTTGAAVLGLTAAQLTFDDEFNTFNNSVNGYYGWGTAMPYSGEAARNFGSGSENYDSDTSTGLNPFTDQNGILTINAAPSTTTLPYGLTYTSGVIQSRYLASQEYGYYEAGIVVPAATGFWPSFYLLPDVNTYGGELDMPEVLTSDDEQVNDITHTVTPTGVATGTKTVAAVPDLSAGFNTVGADWEPGQITWYVDGVVTAIQQTPSDFDTPMYMVLTLAVGGWAGTPVAGSTGAFQIDYVRSYATAATAQVSGSDVITAGSVSGTVVTPAGAGILGVTVSLVNAVNQIVTTATTDVNGYFIFTSLAAGDYHVLYTPSGSSVPAVGSQADATTGLSAVAQVTDGSNTALAAEAFSTATLSAVTGTVLFAATGSSGTAQSGVMVTLENASGTVLDSTITDSTGTFRFFNLAAGNYEVSYTPLHYNALVSGPAGTSGTTAAFSTTAGQTTTLAPETMGPAPGAVSGIILYSGTHSEGWPGSGEAGVLVSLVSVAGTVVGTTTTASDGSYDITGVPAGYYFVKVTPPSGQVVADGFGTNVVTNETARLQAVSGRGTVAPNVVLINGPAPSISGSVLFSAPGVDTVANPNVSVSLLSRSHVLMATTTTALDGTFSFTNMEPGAYYLSYTAPAGEIFKSGSSANWLASLTIPSGTSITAPAITLLGSAGSITGTVLYSPTSTVGTADPGITVNLISASGLTVQTVTTDSNGAYSFLGLIPGSYTVQFALPSGQKVEAGGPAYNSGSTGAIVIASGQAVIEPAQTLIPIPGNVSGSVKYAGSGQAGVTVSLIAANGSTAATTTTTSTGAFIFHVIPPGSYQVLYTAPTGEAPIAGGPADPGTGLTAAFAVNANQTTYLSAETLVAAGSLGIIAGSTLLGTAPQAGVTVTLLNAAGTAAVATATTDVNGAFSFASLAPGSYQVEYAAPAGDVLQSGPGSTSTGLTGVLTVAAGQTLTLGAETLAAAPVTITGSTLLGMAAQAGVTVTLLNAAGTAVLATATTDANGNFSFASLTAGSYQVQYTAPAGEVLQSGPGSTSTGLTGVLTVAAGQTLSLGAETLAPAPATITGSTLLGTAAQAGVTVTLLNATGTAVLATATTDANGNFSFTGLAAGSYQVEYAAPAGELLQSGPGSTSTGLTGVLTVAAGQTLSLGAETLAAAPATIIGSTLLGAAAQAGVTVTLLNATGTAVLATATTNASGNFSFTGLAAGSYQVEYAAPAGELLQSGPGSTSTGLTGVLTVAAGQVLTLGTETLAAAPATITGSTLLGTAPQAGVTVTLLNAAGTATLATATTSAAGAFSFGNLAAGSYQVKYTAPSGETLQSGPGTISTGLTGVLTVTAGQMLTLGAETLTVAGGAVTGSVKFGATVQPGVTVVLQNSAGTATLATTTTNSYGVFGFNSLTPGYYRLQYIAPSGDVIQSGPANAATGETTAFSVTAGGARTIGPVTLAAAYAGITGTVLFASPGQTGAGQAGVTVALLNSTGTATLATATSDSNGAFSFSQLTPGSYTLLYTAPSGELLQSGPASTSTGRTSPVTLVAGQTLALAPETLASAAAALATLTGSVLFAGAGQPGITVALLSSTGSVAATATSDGNGNFSFANLAAGSYALDYTAPAGEIFQTGDPANTATGITGLISLAAGQTVAAAPEHLLLAPVSLTMSGRGVTLTEGNAPFIVTGSPTSSTLILGNSNQSVTLGGFSNMVTLGNGNDTVTLTGPTQTLHVGDGSQTVTLNGNFDIAVLGNTPSGQTSTIAVNGTGEVVTAGNGNVAVTGPTGSSTVILGNGNDTVTLSGSHNSITVGTGTSVINAGTNSETVHAAGGNVTVTVAGQSNLVDIGPGTGVINAGTASRLDTFMLNGINQGLTIINGFNAGTGDVLDLARTLAGTGVTSATLSNIGSYITASVSNGNTTLLVDSTGGSGTPASFATLEGVTTSVSTLLAQHAFNVN